MATTKTINVEIEDWQELHRMYYNNPKIGGVKYVIKHLIKRNKELKKRVAELEGQNKTSEVAQ